MLAQADRVLIHSKAARASDEEPVMAARTADFHDSHGTSQPRLTDVPSGQDEESHELNGDFRQTKVRRDINRQQAGAHEFR
jgi:hypothetical protein